jgi:RNA polymerase sigma-70 factor (ECF subfamily)
MMPTPPAISHLSDAELVVRCRLGNQPAWNLLVERFGGYVDAIVRRGYRLNDADAEDVFQDIFIRTYEHLPRLRDDAAIRPWIGQLTAGCASTACASAAVEVPSANPVDDHDRRAQDDHLARIDEAIVVHDALAGLPPDMREMLERFFLHDQSYRTIAEELDLPLGTIASRIARGLTRLRAELGTDVKPTTVEPLLATA